MGTKPSFLVFASDFRFTSDFFRSGFDLDIYNTLFINYFNVTTSETSGGISGLSETEWPGFKDGQNGFPYEVLVA